MKLLPGGAAQVIAETAYTNDFVQQALKRCAPLAAGGWKMFLEAPGSNVRYGVFHGDLHSLAISVEDALFSVVGTELPVMRVHQIAEDCVEIRNSLGYQHNVYLSNKRETDPSPNRYLSALVTAICADVKGSLRDKRRDLHDANIARIFSESHGCLAAVTKTPRTPLFLRDGIHLIPPLNIAKQVDEA
jgi:hypothetical protein